MAALLMLLLLGAPVVADPLGQRPAYSGRSLSTVANGQAITRRIWVPGLAEGYVPQGLTVVDGALYLAAYKSRSKAQSRGPCRIFRLSPETGAVTGTLDMPSSCGHAGGLARGPKGVLFVADTRTLYVVRLEAAGAAGIGRVTQTIRLTGRLKGSFATGTGDAVWLGTYSKDGPARIYSFQASGLPNEIDERAATRSLPLPERSQGAAFDKAGRLWVSQSSSRFGKLSILDGRSGKVLKTYATASGVEDLSFDAAGRLWTVSEAGAIKWLGWHQFYPVLYRLDVAKLK
ncbi:MAG: hypothetical protein AB7E70_16940 [Hyphomicrobiaceae bacterium]